MTRYVGACACKGTAPKCFKHNLVNRNRLVSKMMQNRHVLRIIEAPSGFGKSCLAAQYADILYSFRYTYWVDCASPCFCRDLDSDELLIGLFERKSQIRLIIFDNIQSMTQERNNTFRVTLESLLDEGIEVVCTWTPFNRPTIIDEVQSISVIGKELLFTNKEISRQKGNIANRSIESIENSIFRIPSLASIGSDDCVLIENLLNENLNEDFSLSCFFIYLSSELWQSDLVALVGQDNASYVQKLSVQYPQLGYSEKKYSVPVISIDKLLKIFWRKLPEFTKLLGLTTEDLSPRQACVALGDYFISHLKLVTKRTFEILRYTCSASVKINTLQNNFIYVINHFCWKDVLLTINNIPVSAVKKSPMLFAQYSLLLAIVKDIKLAKRNAYTILNNDTYNNDSKVIAAFIFAWFGTQSEYYRSINICSHYSKVENVYSPLSNTLQGVLADIVCCNSDPVNFVDYFSDLEQGNLIDSCINILIMIKYLKINGIQSLSQESLIMFIRKTQHVLPYEDEISDNYVAYLCIKECLSIKGSIKIHYDIECFNFSEKLCNKLDEVEYCLSNMFKPDESEIFVGKQNMPEISNNKLRCKKIKIHVFGGLKVTIDGALYTDSKLTRQKSRILLTILVLHSGKDVNKDYLLSLMWPDCVSADSKKNLNTVISDTKRFLNSIDSRAGYLQLAQNSLCLNSDYVETDIAAVEKLCDALTIGPLNYNKWYELISNNNGIFNGELMPSENGNSYINIKRTEYNNQIVDALVIAGNRLFDAGEIQQALWFGHKAYMRNAEREDVFELVIKTQYATGQRSSAIETYFACKKILENKLGLSPSSNIKRLYQKIIQE